MIRSASGPVATAPASVPPPIVEGEVSLDVGSSSPRAAAEPRQTTGLRNDAPRRSSIQTDGLSCGSVDNDESNIDALREAGLAIDAEVADPDAKDDEVLGAEGQLPWIKRNRNGLKLVLNLVSCLVLVLGVVLATPVSPEQLYAFRWPIFLGAIIPIFFLTKIATKSLYHWLEVHYYREQLFHFSSMKRSTHHLLFFIVLLIWYFLVFELLWCRHTIYNGVCKHPDYVYATRVMMRIILCCMLASFASFLAALAAKRISTHFLKSTHFKKLHLALEKEHYLKRLSNPKLRRKVEQTGHKGTKVLSVPNLRDVAKELKVKPGMGRLSVDGNLTSIWNAKRPGRSRHRSYDDADPAYLGNTKDAKPLGGMSKGGSLDDLASISKLDDDLPATPTHATVHGSSASNDGASTGPPSPSAGAKNQFFQREQSDDVELTIGQNILNGINLEMLAEERDVDSMTEEEVDRLRTAVVIKTSSAMMRQHKFRTKEEKEQQLRNTKAFGKVLFYTIRGREGRQPFFTYQDVKLFFPDTVEGKKEARSAFSLFALDRKSKVTSDQVVDAVTAIHKDRSNISASLNNTQSMIKSLQSCLAAGLHFLFFAFYLLIWRIDILAGFSAFSATVLALSFIFGNTICNLFESMLFLFVQHPYDIGDWVEFDGKSYEVVKISLMNTVFYASGMIRTVIPNATLIPKEIRNMSRLDTHLEIMTIQVDYGMVEVVKDEIRHALLELTKQFSNDYFPSPLWVVYTGVEAANMKANLLVLWTYACAPADWERKHPARDRAVQLVTNIVAKHHSNGATYSYNHRITPGIPAEVMNAIGSAGAAPASAGNAAEGLRAHRLKNSSYAL